jgi:AcrR family transcriptional regulator
MTRKYEKKRRAELEAETRRRIAAVTAGLHEEVGPARTTIKEIAERAGVTRPTVYKHFPDEGSLFAACSAHFRASNPAPDISAWSAVADPEERLQRGLAEMYDYYGRTEAMSGNIRRDAESIPALRQVLEEGWQPFLVAAIEVLAAGWGVRGARRNRLLAAIDVALDFATWRRTVRINGLSDAEAVELMAGLVRTAAGR